MATTTSDKQKEKQADMLAEKQSDKQKVLQAAIERIEKHMAKALLCAWAMSPLNR